jgi:hypothetical protein
MVRPAVPKRCDPCHDEPQKLYKVDALAGEVRCVTGSPWPGQDSDGDTCFVNTHFKTHREALDKLRAECDAWLSLNFLERGRLHERLTALQEKDKIARAGLQHAQAGLAQTGCGCRDGTCESKPSGCRMAAEVARRDPAVM